MGRAIADRRREISPARVCQAAEILGIERSTLDRKIKVYGLQRD
jgi:DNA-binding protein Fis